MLRQQSKWNRVVEAFEMRVMISRSASTLGAFASASLPVSVNLSLRQGQRHLVHGLCRSPPRQGAFEKKIAPSRRFAVNSSQAVLAGLNGEVSTECLDCAWSSLSGARTGEIKKGPASFVIVQLSWTSDESCKISRKCRGAPTLSRR